MTSIQYVPAARAKDKPRLDQCGFINGTGFRCLADGDETYMALYKITGSVGGELALRPVHLAVYTCAKHASKDDET